MAGSNILSRNAQAVGAVIKPLADSLRLSVAAAIRTRRLGSKAYAGAEITDYDSLDPATAAQPYDAYRRLHASGRVHYNPKRVTWILSRHEHVRAALTDTDQINSTHGVTRIRFPLALVILTDGEQHAQLRRMVQPGFTKRALDSWTPMIECSTLVLANCCSG